MNAFLFLLLCFAVLHLWAIRQHCVFAAEGDAPGLVREQVWARGWFPATASFFNIWFCYTILNQLFLKPHGHWQMPGWIKTLGDSLFLIAALILTLAYLCRHLPEVFRTGSVLKRKIYHAIHGLTGLLVLGGFGYLIFFAGSV